MLGIDLIEVDRIQKFIDSKTSQRLLRIFTNNEIEYALSSQNKYQRFAIRFATKEAVFKALGFGNFYEIELGRQNQRPEIILYGTTKQKWIDIGSPKIHVSVSHSNNYAIASVFCQH